MIENNAEDSEINLSNSVESLRTIAVVQKTDIALRSTNNSPAVGDRGDAGERCIH